MKVNLNLEQTKNKNNFNFKGYVPVKSEYGAKEYEFNYVFDDDKYDCYLEIFGVDKDSDGNYYTTGIHKRMPTNPEDINPDEPGIKLQSGKATKVDLLNEFNITENEPFAYYYKLCPKNQHNGAKWTTEAGQYIDETNRYGNARDKFNIVVDRASTVSKGGAMKLIVPDINNVLWIYGDKKYIERNPEIEKLRRTSKTFPNKYGGSLAGIEKDLENGKLDNFTRIITLPLFTDDCLSAHAYWNKNCMQMVHSLGNITNYNSLQKKLFAKGINLVSDGAYVNEGLEGIHFQHILKWGEKSPYMNWFKITDLQSGPLSLGVFGQKSLHTTHRLINSKYAFEQKVDGMVRILPNRQYDSKSPTYIQIYDNRIRNGKNLSNKELISAYNKINRSHIEINTHNDTVIPYNFRIDSETYKKNVEKLNEYNKKLPEDKRIFLYSGKGTRLVSHFEYFGLDSKHESGFETWDANADIAKLNYAYSHNDTEKLMNILNPDERMQAKNILIQNNMQVQDYAVTSAKYWTKKTNDILNLYVAQNLKNIKGKTPQEITKQINRLSNGKVFPKNLDINEDIVKNVLNGSYELHGNDSNESFDELVTRSAMEYPLDSIEVGDDIVAVLASPYITKRAIKSDQVGVSRYDMYKNGNKHVLPEFKYTYELTDKLYTKEITDLAKTVFANIDERLERNGHETLRDSKGNPTDYGKYILPMLTGEIVRYAVIKSVDPKMQFNYNFDTGEIKYDFKTLKNTSLMSMGIIATSPEDEALSLIEKIRHRIKKFSDGDKNDITNAIWESINGTDTESFKLAEMIVKKAQAGLDWRIDATKDIVDIESLRNGQTDFKDTWDTLINFWSKFVDGIKEYHPDAYIAAEVTDENDLYKKGEGNKSGARYADDKEAVKKLMNEAGFTTLANYSYFASDITKIFGKMFEFNGKDSPETGTEHNGTVQSQLERFINSGSLESLLYSYTFAGNHDKPRALDAYAMDMEMVFANLSDKNPKYDKLRERAYRVLEAVPYGHNINHEKLQNYDFDRVSCLAVAKCESITSGMGQSINELPVDQPRKDYINKLMREALSQLAQGKFKDEVFEADGFGSKDYNTALNLVLKEMDYLWDQSLEQDKPARLTETEKMELKNKSLEKIIKPAMTRLLGQTKFLVALLGNPTLYGGDEYGSTGFETKTKNMYLQNRNIIHEEWGDSDENSPLYKAFVKKFKDDIDAQYNLRKRKELEPLNNGTPFILKQQNARVSKEYGIDNPNNGQKWTQMSSLLRQSPDGRMTVSLFNTTGLNHSYNVDYVPGTVELDYIDLNQDGNKGLPGGIRKGIKFRNANPEDQTVYEVNDKNQIVAQNNDKIRCNDSTLILYSEPSFTGRRIMYNPQYNFRPANSYQEKQEVITGSKLALVSK